MSAKLKPYEGGDDDFNPIMILLRGQDEWNPWRARNSEFFVDFQGVDLIGAKLTGVNLSGADLSEADLSEANLRRASFRLGKLRKANLSGANLTEANLNVTDLSEADLSCANLRGAKLRKADLSSTNLAQANLSKANLSGANLIGADLSEANLSKANLSNANLSEADLSKATLRGAKLSEANLAGANLSGADLTWTDLDGANLNGATLIGAKLPAATKLRLAANRWWLAAKRSWPPIRLKKTDSRNAKLGGTDLSGPRFNETEFTGEKPSATVVRVEQFRIFTESSSIEDAEILYKSAKALYEALGFSIEKESDWRRGSLWRSAIARLKGLADSKELGDRARVVENVLLGHHDRETAVELVKAAIDLENAFKGKKGAIAIDMGLFIFLRKSSLDGDGATFVKRLTLEERAMLDRDPTLLGNPEQLFKKIKNMKKAQVADELVQRADKSKNVA
jgi:uncharacterized protein YjbI with pentapeptide repeats